MKSFDIPKEVVWESYKQVKKNKGAAGVVLKSGNFKAKSNQVEQDQIADH